MAEHVPTAPCHICVEQKPIAQVEVCKKCGYLTCASCTRNGVCLECDPSVLEISVIEGAVKIVPEEKSTVHPVSCDECGTVMYECDIVPGTIYPSPEDEYDIVECPGCGEMLILENYSRVALQGYEAALEHENSLNDREFSAECQVVHPGRPHEEMHPIKRIM